MIVENSSPNLALVAKYEPWMDGTMVRIDDDNNIVNFVSKKHLNTGMQIVIIKLSISISLVKSFLEHTMYLSWRLILKHWVIMNIMSKCFV